MWEIGVVTLWHEAYSNYLLCRPEGTQTEVYKKIPWIYFFSFFSYNKIMLVSLRVKYSCIKVVRYIWSIKVMKQWLQNYTRHGLSSLVFHSGKSFVSSCREDPSMLADKPASACGIWQTNEQQFKIISWYSCVIDTLFVQLFCKYWSYL